MRSTSGITCCHFFCSAVFSMPVCRYPIVGAAESTVSTSSSSTRRSTPCVLGCCGPMLTVIVSVRMSLMTLMPASDRHQGHEGHKGQNVQEFSLVSLVSLVSAAPASPLSSSCQPVLLHARPKFGFRHLQGLGRLRRLQNLNGVILPQRIAVPILRHQQ